MSHSNGKITAPVSVADVSYVLGEGSLDVATLCTSGQINPAALWQPRHTGNKPHTEQSDYQSAASDLGQPDNSPGVYGGAWKCMKHGVWVPQFDSLLGRRAWYISDMAWQIRKPDDSSYKDLTHFIGYNHKAAFTDPVESVTVGSSTRTITVTFRTPAHSDDAVTIGNVIPLANDAGDPIAYFGFAAYEYDKTANGPVFDNSAEPRHVIISNPINAIADASKTYTATLTGMDPDKNHDICPFIAVETGSSAGQTTYEYYSLRMGSELRGRRTRTAASERITFEFFNWHEPTYGFTYPDSGNVKETATTSAAWLFSLSLSSSLHDWILAGYYGRGVQEGLIQSDTIKITCTFTPSVGTGEKTGTFTLKDGINLHSGDDPDVVRMYILDSVMRSKLGDNQAGYFEFKVTMTLNIEDNATEVATFPGTERTD